MGRRCVDFVAKGLGRSGRLHVCVWTRGDSEERSEEGTKALRSPLGRSRGDLKGSGGAEIGRGGPKVGSRHRKIEKDRRYDQEVSACRAKRVPE